jgi:hypothetical protein
MPLFLCSQEPFAYLNPKEIQLDLKNTRVLITGVGVKPLGHVFYDITTHQPSHTPIFVNGKEYKANLGSAIAFVPSSLWNC